jgi:WhiB family transcriptional regulator, redox-sensing transcriptional regulator
MSERRSFFRDEIDCARVDDATDSETELDLVAQLRSLIDRSGWHTRAACRGRSDVNFFPTRGESIRVARSLCSGCAVCAECLEYALTHDRTVGVWGGMTERERKRVRRERLAS